MSVQTQIVERHAGRQLSDVLGFLIILPPKLLYSNLCFLPV